MRLFALLTHDLGLRRRTQAALRSAAHFARAEVPERSSWLIADDSPPGTVVSVLEGADAVASVHAEELVNRCRYAQLASLPGDFTFFCVAGGDEAMLVRSAAGTASLFLWHGSSGLAVSSRMGDLLRFIPEEPPLDRLANALLCGFAAALPDGRTPFERVRLVENGCTLHVVSPYAFKQRRWWNPPVSERPEPHRVTAHAEELLDILTSALRAGTDPGGANLFTLSGGLDSTVLALLMAKSVRRPFSAVTLVPARAPDRAVMRAQTEPLFEELRPALVRRWEFEHSVAARMRYLSRARPEVGYVGHPVLLLLESLCEQQPTTHYVGGEFCDQILGGGGYVALDYLFCSTLVDVLLRPPNYLAGPMGVPRWGKAKVRRMFRLVPIPIAAHAPPECLSDLARQDYLDAARDQQATLADDRRPRAALAYQVQLAQPVMVQNWEVTARLGVRRVFPFFNRRAIELAFRTHPLDLADATEKSLVRRAAGLTLRGFERAKFAWRDPPSRVDWNKQIPYDLAGIVRSDWIERPPATLWGLDALRLQVALNLVTAVRTIRATRLESGK